MVYEPPSLMELRWKNETLRFEVDADGTGFGPEASVIGPPEEWERVHGSGDTGVEG